MVLRIFRYTHVEAECSFITFEELLDRLEDLICDVVDRVLNSPLGHLVKELNPDFKVPKKPFKRMSYSDAIEYLRVNRITKEDGTFYEFGEVRTTIIIFLLFACTNILALCIVTIDSIAFLFRSFPFVSIRTFQKCQKEK